MHIQTSFQALKQLKVERFLTYNKLIESQATHISINAKLLMVKNIEARLKALERFSYIEIYADFDYQTKANEVLQNISQIKNLKTLIIANGQAIQFEQLDKLQNIEYLYLGNTTNPFRLGDISKLKLKGIEINGGVTDELNQILNIDSLEELFLTRVNINDAFVANLDQLQNLKAIAINKPHTTFDIPPSFQKLKKLSYISFRNNDIKKVPNYFIQYKALYYLNFGNNPNMDWNQYFEILSNFPKIKSLDLSSSGLKSISPKIALMHTIEALNINNNQIHALPDEIRQLKNLSKIRLTQNKNLSFSEMFTAVGNLPLIKEFTIEHTHYRPISDDFEMLSNIEKLTFHQCNFERLPQSFGQLKKLKSLSFINCKDLIAFENTNETLTALTALQLINTAHIDYKDFFENRINPTQILDLHLDFNTYKKVNPFFHLFKNLKNLVFTLDHTAEINNIFKSVSKITSLETLTCHNVETLNFQKVFGKLKFLKKITLNTQKSFTQTQIDNISFSIEVAKFEHTQLESNNPNIFTKVKYYFEHYAPSELSKERKLIAFAILNNATNEILAKTKNHLLSQTPIPQASTFFLLGQIQGFNKTTLKKKLKEYSFKLQSQLNASVNYVILGTGCDPEMLEQVLFNQQYSLILEDHLKAYFWKKESPYLMENNTDDMLESIITLLLSQNKENILLGLQMCEGGGVNNKIISYLTALMLYHLDKKVRKESRKLFKVYASSSLQAHIKANKKPKMVMHEQKETEIMKIAIHPELNAGAVFIAQYIVKELECLIFDNTSFKSIPEEIKYFNKLHSVSFKNNKDYDWDTNLEILKQMPKITSINLIDETLTFIPEKLFELKNLSYLSIRTQATEIPANIGNCTNLKTIFFSGTPIETFPESFAKLKKLSHLCCQECNLKSIDAVAKLPKLKNLLLNNNAIEAIPFGFGNNHVLEHVQLDNNMITNIAEDFGSLTNLNLVSLSNNKITKLPTITDWSKLVGLVIFNNEIKELPKGLSNCKQLNNIRAYNNFIEKIPIEVIKIPKLTNLDLGDNNIKEIPSFLKDSSISYLMLENNQITKLPHDFRFFKNITNIYLEDNQITSIPDSLPPQFMKGSRKEAVLSLSHNPIPKEVVKEYMRYSNIDL